MRASTSFLRAFLPCVTLALPVLAALPVLHGALAAVVAVTVPLVVDAALGAEALAGPDEPRAEAVDRNRRFFVAYALLTVVSFVRSAVTSAGVGGVDLAGSSLSWIVLHGVPTLVVGHALVHERSRRLRALGQLVFLVVGYPHFPVVHVEGHHRHVATAADVHSAARGVSFYAFFARYVVGEHRFVQDQVRRGRYLSTWLVLEVARIGLLAVVAASAGVRGVLVYVVTCLLGRVVVASVNYVQHYGLERHAGEKPGEGHAWDLPHRSANWMFFEAGLHVDHHAKASTPPGRLVLRARAHLLPYNIPVMLPMALVPPIFFRVMHAIADAGGPAALDVTSFSGASPRCCRSGCASSHPSRLAGRLPRGPSPSSAS